MLRFHPSRIGWILVLALGSWAAAAQAERYRYVSLDDKASPGFDFFFPAAINDSGKVSGTVFNCDDVSCFDDHVAIYKDRAVTVLQPGDSGPINAGGTIGGGVVLDPINFITQAALFHGNQVELIPLQPGNSSFVSRLTDSGTALVRSFDSVFDESYSIYKNGRSSVLDFGPTITHPFIEDIYGRGLDMNNKGILAGTTGPTTNPKYGGARGFRFDPTTGEATLLNPVATQLNAWGMGINKRGDVVGCSFFSPERVGIWDRQRKFKTYFVEVTPEFSTSSNQLLFNDKNLIVITWVILPTSEVGNSYLVPKPGMRLNLAELVVNLPPGTNLKFITDINNRGDMLGFGSGGYFLLERIDDTEAGSERSGRVHPFLR